MGRDRDQRRGVRRDVRQVVAAALVLGLLAGGCAGIGDGPEVLDEAPGEGAGVPEEAAGGDQSDSETGELVTPRPGMIDVEPVEIWLEYGSWEGDLSYVMFLSQGAPCEVLDRVELEDGPDAEGRWVVTLYQGRDPEIDPAEPCDGPSRAFTVVLPAFELTDSGDGEHLVNGARPTDDR